METIKKPKIEAIFPLTYMQQGLLFHHLSSKNDKGFLNVECALRGNMNVSIFEKAWNRTIQRHAVLRTTVHWQNLDKPVTIVHQEKSIILDYFDWGAVPLEERNEMWKDLKDGALNKGVSFEKGPLLNLALVNFGADEYKLLWPSHHLVIDGWSSQVILNDLLTTYDALLQNQEPALPRLPSLRSYNRWINNKDPKKAADFWKSYFKNFKEAPIFEDGFRRREVQNVHSKLRLSIADSAGLQALARKQKITLNSLIQGAWAILLGRYFETQDVTYGTTVSGRSGDFPNMELMTGMFMNIQPVRNVIDKREDPEAWFQDLQRRQQEARLYEHINLDDIASYIDWPEGRPMFDSILIFENYPRTQPENRALEIINFKSGITSTYALTLAIIPGEEIEFLWAISPGTIDEESSRWMIQNWETILKLLAVSGTISFDKLYEVIPVLKKPNTGKKVQVKKKLDATGSYMAPRNETELQLVKIWENLFGKYSISINDDFFALGGKSLLASKMFSIINRKMNVQLKPTSLLAYPTIASIAKLLTNGSNLAAWKNLVPIRSKGSKPALFCVHAGGGHVFFYNLLAKYLIKDRPIYALQPSGILGDQSMHSNIEEMANAYVNEIRSVQPEGPFNLMVYCFSTAVGLEMSKVLKADGFDTNLIVMDTMAEQGQVFNKKRLTMRIFGFFKRLARNPSKVLSIMFIDRYNRYIKPIWVRLTGSKEEKNTELMRLHLAKIYNKYPWQACQDDIKLVLTEKADKRFNKEFIRSWEAIAKGGVQVIEIVGDHRSLFEEPDVRIVAETIDKCML